MSSFAFACNIVKYVMIVCFCLYTSCLSYWFYLVTVKRKKLLLLNASPRHRRSSILLKEYRSHYFSLTLWNFFCFSAHSVKHQNVCWTFFYKSLWLTKVEKKMFSNKWNNRWEYIVPATSPFHFSAMKKEKGKNKRLKTEKVKRKIKCWFTNKSLRAVRQR